MLSRPSRGVVTVVLVLSMLTPGTLGPSSAHAGYAGGGGGASLAIALGVSAAILGGCVLIQRHKERRASKWFRAAPDSTRLNWFAPDPPEELPWGDAATRFMGGTAAAEMARPEPRRGLRLEPIVIVRDQGTVVGASLSF